MQKSRATIHARTAGIVNAEYTNRARDIANTPGGEMTPAKLAEEAQKIARGTGVKVRVLNKSQIKKERLHALMAVAQGSSLGPRFIIMEYWGRSGTKAAALKSTKKADRPIVLAGKGITFDTGGLSMKPSEALLDMHLDMSGGATVMAAISAAAKMKYKHNIVALIPAAENAVSDASFRPGDIIDTHAGKTVEVLNTDAEGRLVLADALSYAAQYKPRLVVDVATLTGAALVALGTHASAVLTSDKTLQEQLVALGEKSGDYVWPLPLWNEYTIYTKGNFADIANIASSGSQRYGGTINGAAFLQHFTEKYPKDCAWAHIDMAPRMVAGPHDQLAKGATGEPVRLLLALLEGN